MYGILTMGLGSCPGSLAASSAAVGRSSSDQVQCRAFDAIDEIPRASKHR